MFILTSSGMTAVCKSPNEAILGDPVPQASMNDVRKKPPMSQSILLPVALFFDIIISHYD